MSERGAAEIMVIGGTEGVVIERQIAPGGSASFTTSQGLVTCQVYKARTPEVRLEGATVCLLQRRSESGELEDAYAVMVDDPYWGRVVGPSAFAKAPFEVDLVVGYRVKGRVLRDGVPVKGANVSLEGLVTTGTGQARFWDSLEFNELVWSNVLETWVEGPTVLAPIRTDAEGQWEFLCPGGVGGVYERDPNGGRARTVQRLWAVYQGRRVELLEGVEAVINLLSGRLVVHGEPGCWVRIGTLDDAGESFLIQEDGTAIVESLPSGEHSLVQYRLDGSGGWDSTWGCARQVVMVKEGKTASVTMGLMEAFDPAAGVIAGRVYERMGVPAAGVQIIAVNFETEELGAVIATTDEDGLWSVQTPEEGLGGDPWIMDERWGSVPVVGFPYSDTVLGARAYSGWQEMYKPEAWRKGDRGHANFQYVPKAVWVEDDCSATVYETEEAEYGGWVTVETLPKYRYVTDVQALIVSGPQKRQYSLHTSERVLEAAFELGNQPFEAYETVPGQFRAAGHYPEAKFLIGGKISGGVVTGRDESIGVDLAEATRLGLEFGRHEWYTLVAARRRDHTTDVITMATWADLVCAYCGGPLWRDPDNGEYRRGFCQQCADAFEMAEAMDGRTHFITPTISATVRHELETVRGPGSGKSKSETFRYHWRPDLYDENDTYLTQNGPGQATNAPRWMAQHVDQVADGLGFGRFESQTSPPFSPGHSLAYFAILPQVQRELGLAQLKLALPVGYVQETEAVVELDCVRADGMTETVRGTVPAGTQGPDAEGALGQVVPVSRAEKGQAEETIWPFKGCGLYTAVTGARMVSGSDCRFTVVNDTPLLAATSGVLVTERQATPVALQIGRSIPSGPHLMDDAVGQVFLFYEREGQIWMRRRAGLPGGWQEPRQITFSGTNREPVAEKDGAGKLRLLWMRKGGTSCLLSHDDGEAWMEV